MGKTWTVKQFKGAEVVRKAVFSNRGAAEWQASEWVKELMVRWLEEEQDRVTLTPLKWDDINMFLKEADIKVTIVAGSKEDQ